MIVAPPQTPRLKTKLSLDIPSSYSNTSCPDSPSSQFATSPAFTPPTRPFDGSVPPSPTWSGTLNSNRSQAELTVLLKEAYSQIRERERDLTLAAEIGKSLLENNIQLKSKYESAIVQLQHLQRARSKAATFSMIQGEKNATPIAPPNTSFDHEEYDYEESDAESLNGWSSSFDLPSPSGDIPHKRKNHQNSGGGLNFKDLENIKDLETRNQELQQQLEDAIREYNECDKTNKSKIRKLETDLQHYHDACVLATQKVEDLEKENERLLQKQKADFWNLKYSKKSNENEDFIETLLHKVQELEEQNDIVEKAKLEIERRLTRTTNELETLKVEYEDLVETSKDYEMLQLSHRDQQKLIAELNENLEEQRALVVNYRSGIWSQKTSRANSISDGGIMSNAIRRLSNPDGMRDMFGVSKQNDSSGGIGGKIRKSLLSELESEWFRELTIFQRDVNKGRDSTTSSPGFSPITSEKDLNDYFLSNGARPDDDLDYLSDDEFSFLGEFEINNEEANRLREWFWKRWARAIYRFLRKIWRWCRFIVILIAAVLMALYRGPDDVLPNDM
ncbi:hypothetical protein C1645_833648 [Glomus cerebriforme]|uniref:Uncharacterized protein n=1 Tax=Glomus cerebriforme TaxID=658196 RepID=A0A397SB56_9GLOM|nr:hypothetical protein C1645_833648 [Glomus cerebriforme]